MNSVVDDVYQVNLATSGKLKMRALGRLAEGTDEAVFDACVLLHEAARLQRRAVDALPMCPPITRLTSAVEECWCYVEGHDPPRAADAWGDVLRAQKEVESEAAKSVLSRLEPRFRATHQAFSGAIRSSATLLAIRDARRLSGLMPAELTKARKELGMVLTKFPGAASFWWMQYRLAEASEKKQDAWNALARCRRLEPDNQRFLAMSLLVAAWALPTSAADKAIASAWGSLVRAEPGVCLMYALAEIALARREHASGRKLRWKRAREAADMGMARVDSESLRRNLKATQLLLNELLAGREPTMDILYLAGLPELATMEKPNANVADILITTRLQLAA